MNPDSPRQGEWTLAESHDVGKSVWPKILRMGGYVLGFALGIYAINVSSVPVFLLGLGIYSGAQTTTVLAKRRNQIKTYRKDLDFKHGMFLVRIHVREGYANKLGDDVGQVWFEDNCIKFNGSATSFVIGVQDVRKGFVELKYRHVSNFEFPASHPGFVPQWSQDRRIIIDYPGWLMWVGFETLDGENKQFEAALKKFIELREPAVIPRQYPPSYPRPWVPLKRKTPASIE